MNTGFLGPAVATVLTACGIETTDYATRLVMSAVATVLTACGIETADTRATVVVGTVRVATVLTACGIETYNQHPKSAITGWLQQYLPLAVLKRRHSL